MVKEIKCKLSLKRYQVHCIKYASNMPHYLSSERFYVSFVNIKQNEITSREKSIFKYLSHYLLCNSTLLCSMDCVIILFLTI